MDHCRTESLAGAAIDDASQSPRLCWEIVAVDPDILIPKLAMLDRPLRCEIENEIESSYVLLAKVPFVARNLQDQPTNHDLFINIPSLAA